MKRRRFRCPYIKDEKRSLWNILLWRLGFYDEKKSLPAPPEQFSYPRLSKEVNPLFPTAMWMGHCTFLISCSGKNILTDPIWSDRCSPIPCYGPKRRHLPPVSFEDLPRIDLILISHNHYDHLDVKTIKKLHRSFPEAVWIVPTGLKKWFKKRGIEKVNELFWWEDGKYEGINITAVPGQHFSGRSIFDRNRSLWSGYVVEFQNKKRFYFVGDTGYNPYDFKSLGEHFKKMDLSLIPIGTYLPRSFMSPVHVNPQEAVQIHQDVHSTLSIGMHWKTFPLSDEPMNQPPYDLFLAMQEKSLDPQTFLPLEPGEKVNW